MTSPVAVRVSDIEAIRARVERINRRADRIGVPQVVMTVGEPRVIREGVSAATVADVTFSVPSVGFSGWHIVGTVDHTDGIVRSHPNAEFDGLAAFVGKPACDHCGINSHRTRTIVIRHEDGTVKQVGSTCLVDFIGHKVDTTVWEAAAAIEDEFADHDPFRSADPEWDLTAFLSFTSAVIRTHGWVSRSAASSTDMTATTVRVVTELTRLNPDDSIKPTDDDWQLAEAAAAWVEALEPTNDFEHNLSVIAASGIVSVRTAGFAAAIINAFRKVEVARIERESASPCPIASGDRATIIGTIVHTGVKENEFGERVVITVRHEDGWKAWGTMPSALFGAGVGDVVEFSAKVERSDDDTFVFFSRPTKAKVLSTVA